MNNDDTLRYPIGRLKFQESYTTADRAALIASIAELPEQLKAQVARMTTAQLDTPYRPGGWTGRQVVHHLADSHMNAYIRLKWTLTEDTPTIKAYNEKMWAETPEVSSDPTLSVALIEALHAKWVVALKELQEEDWKKSFLHPESGKHVSLERQLATYAWHGAHHLGHLALIANG